MDNLRSARENAFVCGMTKAENRAATKAYQQEKELRWREEARAAAVAADLEEMRKLRHCLIFHAKAHVPTRALIDAIDDHAEKLTGDRRTLHGHWHSIG
jgi:hypothetical protein